MGNKMAIFTLEESGVTTSKKKARQVKSNVKSMLIGFFEQEGMVQKEFVSVSETVSAEPFA